MVGIKEIKNKTLTMKWIELKHDKKIEDLLYEMYIEKEMSIREISSKLDIHYHTVNKWIKLIGIEMRLPHQKLLDLIDIKIKLKEGS